MFMIPSIECCKLPSLSFWIAKRCTLSRKDNGSLAWQTPFCYSLMFKKFLFLPNHSINVCVKGKIINRGVEYGSENRAEYKYIFYDNKKAIQWAKKTLDGFYGNVKKSFNMFKIQLFFKKISYSLLVFCFFWPVRYWEIIFTGLIQTGLELSVR